MRDSVGREGRQKQRTLKGIMRVKYVRHNMDGDIKMYKTVCLDD